MNDLVKDIKIMHNLNNHFFRRDVFSFLKQSYEKNKKEYIKIR